MSGVLETTAALRGPAPPGPGVAPREAGAEFESFLLGRILRQATQPIGGETLLDGGSAGRMYRELLYEEMSRVAAEQRSLGIAEMVARQMGKTGEDGR